MNDEEDFIERSFSAEYQPGEYDDTKSSGAPKANGHAPDDSDAYIPPEGEPESRATKPEPLECVKLSEWFGKEPPEREWFVPDWIPIEGEVFGLYGEGGIGKSFIALLTQTVSALALSWFGLPIKSVPSLGIYCEDSQTELWRRQDRIVRHLVRDGVVPPEYAKEMLSKATVCSRRGKDNLIITLTKGGKAELTRFHAQILEQALDEKCKLVFLDNAATIFPGNQIDPFQVRQLVDFACGGIATKIGGAVGLCCHPSKSGIISGSGESGSVQWNAAFRSRLYASHPKSSDGAEDKKTLILTRKKGNYADVEAADEIRLRWEHSTLVVDQPQDARFRPPVKDVFLTLLDIRASQSRHVSDKPRAWTYAPKVFAGLNEHNHGYSKFAFVQAMEELFAEGGIENQEIKVDRKPLTVIARK